MLILQAFKYGLVALDTALSEFNGLVSIRHTQVLMNNVFALLLPQLVHMYLPCLTVDARDVDLVLLVGQLNQELSLVYLLLFLQHWLSTHEVGVLVVYRNHEGHHVGRYLPDSR